MDYRDFFQRNIHRLNQAGLLRPACNPTFRNPPWDESDFRVLIIRLSPFRDVERSTPHLFLASSVRASVPSAFIDMCFFPVYRDRLFLEKEKVPLITGIQSYRTLDDFDLILVSNSYTLELLNLGYLFLRSGIPLFAGKRDDTYPLVILGGSNASAAQGIISVAERQRSDSIDSRPADAFVDAIFFGEAEGQIEKIISVLYTHKALSKRERLMEAARLVAGLWVPGTMERVTKAVCRSFETIGTETSYPVLNGAEASTARLMISFGCPFFCSFCFEGYDRKPYREITAASLIKRAEELKKSSGASTLELFSFNFNTQSDIFTLLFELNKRFLHVNYMSQRLDILLNTPGLLQAEIAGGKNGFTLGIEGISLRLRTFLHKGLDEESVLSLLEKLISERVRQIKLFYIITGYEGYDDLGEFEGFLKKLTAIKARCRPGVRIIFSFGLLIRMPFTPLRYDRLMLEENAVKPVLDGIEKVLDAFGLEYRFAFSWEDYCVSQVLAAGGYWLIEPVSKMAERGIWYDGRLPKGTWRFLKGWMMENGFWTEEFLGEKREAYSFPLAFLESSITKNFLYREFLESKAGQESGSCLGQTCLKCGACPDNEERAQLTGHRLKIPPIDHYISSLQALIREKPKLASVYVLTRIHKQLAGTSKEWLNAACLRAIFKACPELAALLLAAEECLFSELLGNGKGRGGSDLLWYGETVFKLKSFNSDAITDRLSKGLSLNLFGETVQAIGEGLEIVSVLREYKPSNRFLSFLKVVIHLELPRGSINRVTELLAAFFKKEYLGISLRKAGSAYKFDISEKAKRKKIIFEGRVSDSPGGCELDVTVSPRFNFAEFARTFSSSAVLTMADNRQLCFEIKDIGFLNC
ncbi:MAG: radical SAM protein [Spirochaetota bacterium]